MSEDGYHHFMSIVQATKGEFIPHFLAPSPGSGIGGYKQQASGSWHDSKMLQYDRIIKPNSRKMRTSGKSQLPAALNALSCDDGRIDGVIGFS
jgi:hypothetical protein